MERYRTLTEAIQTLRHTTDKGIIHISRKDKEDFTSYQTLYDNASQILFQLQKKGIKQGQELLFQIEDNSSFLEVFWACLLGGIIPVPISIGNNAEHKMKVIKVWRVMKNSSMIIDQKLLPSFFSFAKEHIVHEEVESIEARTFTVEEVCDVDSSLQGHVVTASPDDIAFIQFSSGSTGDPKGVTLTHENLIYNVYAILEASESVEGDSYLSWMPLTHDMGMIAFHLAPLVSNNNQYIMPTSLFIRRPVLWWHKVNEHKATILGSPNFGYKFFLSRFKPSIAADWDLSHVRIIFNGAEPILVDLCNEFLDALSPFGLKRNSMQTVYGMAEASVGVTIPPLNEDIITYRLDRDKLTTGVTVEEVSEGYHNAVSFVEVGQAIPDCEVRICNENNVVQPDRVIGSIQIRGKNVTKGYYNNEETTKKVFSEDGWLNTGDLGFMVNDRLVITGRAKDIIFINGQNYYPHDIERVAEGIEEVKLGTVAAYGAYNENSKSGDVIIFLLYRKSPQSFVDIAEKLSLHINLTMGIEVKEIVPIRKMPKTTSGKVQRYYLGQLYQKGEYSEVLQEIEEVKRRNQRLMEKFIPSNAVEEKLLEMWKEILEVDSIGANSHFFEIGGQSLRAAQLTYQVQKEFQINLTVREIFDCPTIEKLANFIESQSTTKFVDIQQAEEQNYYPVTPAQERMFILSQHNRAETNYNMPWSLSIEGKINKEKLNHAFQSLIQRHESLRTSFKLKDGQLVQKIHQNVYFQLEYNDADEEELTRLKAEFMKPFDLSAPPLLRASLISVHDNKHVLLLDNHHIISDGTSIGVMWNELFELYQGKQLQPLKVQYKDFACWQSDYFKRKSIDQQKEYWLQRFSDGVPTLDLKTDYARPVQRNFKGNTLSFRIDQKLTESLHALALQTGTTLYMVLMAAYKLLLHKYTGQKDIVVGSLAAGRSHPDIQSMIGMFVNTITLRSQPRPDITFTEYLNSLKEHIFNAIENQDFQFQDLVECLSIPRDLSRNPMFDVMFILQNMKIGTLQANGLNIKPEVIDTGGAKFDLLLNAFEQENEIEFQLEYSSQLYSIETAQQITKHYQTILREITNGPQKRIADVTLLSTVGKKKIINQYVDSKVNYPKHKTIHQLFKEQVVRTPRKVAVSCEGKEITYQELNKKADALAFLLKERGIKANQIVGVLMDRSHEMLVSIFAILKAGGAYMPIDPDYPKERIAYMLEDSNTGVILTNQKWNRFDLEFKGEVLDVNQIIMDWNEKQCNDDSTVAPDSLAYIIYTSGSTGKPKGVMIEHRNVVRLLFNDRQKFDFNEQDVWTLFHSYSFDFSVWEMFGALLNGGKLVIVPKSIAQDTKQFVKLVKKEKVTVLNQTPSAFYHFIREKIEAGEKKLELRYVIFGGEALAPIKLKEFKERYPKTKLINMYGITETTVHVTYKEVTEREITANLCDIGKPLPTLTAYVFDSNQKLLPVGVPGELYVGGDGVARGYLNRDELTQERFIWNPYHENERIYRTGDLVRWLPDGNLEYLGRMDHQVKIRGYRIELGEIETHLLKHPLIKEVIVLAQSTTTGESELYAYIVASVELSASVIREYLTSEIPDYMVPSYFIQLKEMPLTTNGKIDRKRLPATRGALVKDSQYEAPRNEIEIKMQKIWEDVLGIEYIGIHDNFFDLGGHSLKATTLVFQVHKVFEVGITLRDVFSTPTIQQLSSYIKNADENKFASIEKVSEKPYFVVSSAQKRLFILNQLGKNQTNYNMPGVFMMEGPIQKDRLEMVLGTLIKRHESFRTSFEVIDGKPMQKIHESVELKINYLKATEKELVDVAQEFIRPFDLKEAPLLRVSLVTLSQEKHVLLIDMHHIISDAVSISVLIKEFTELYKGNKLPSLRIQYKDYAEWQQAFMATNRLKIQEEYWLEQLSGELPVLQLPTDYPRPAIQSHEGDTVHFELSKEMSLGLHKLGEKTGTTLYMILLASYKVLLSKYTQQEDIIVGTPVAGRSHADLENIIGMFVNTLALRNYPKGTKTFMEFLQEVKANSLQALENQDYPFEDLVEKLSIKRDLSRNPIFDTLFNLHGLDYKSFTLDDITIKAMEFNDNVSKFDLTWNGYETSQGTILFDVNYCSRLFQRKTIERIILHYQNIIQKVLNNSQVKLSEIEITTTSEKQQILNEFNSKSFQVEKELCIHQLFEQQVEKTPNRVAIICGDEALTYKELNERANQLARLLREKGVRSNSLVGIMLERSIEMLIGVMGILKAGGAYVPIDLNYPLERMHSILQNTGTNLLLVKENIVEGLMFEGEVLSLNDKSIYVGDSQNLICNSRPTDLSYVIYTSGSTGKPKGIKTEHRNVINILRALQKEYPLKENDFFLLKSNFSFDASVAELFGWFFEGGGLVILGPDKEKDPVQVFQTIDQYGITHVNFVPSMLSVMLKAVQIDDKYKNMAKSLKYVISGGEEFTPSLIQEVYSVFPHVSLVNLYGPTETTIYATKFNVEKGKTYTRTPIGKPFENVQTYILNPNLQLCPIGVYGELCIAGKGVARGYLNREELTAEKFINNPFQTGERLYRTGDLVRWLPDGNIEYAGRIDHQVKIRGFRIELGEIESWLSTYASIKESVVVARKVEGDLGSELCAYFVAEEEISPGEIRNYLKDKLPDYMLPSYFVQLEEMPLTATGKIDRKRLPAPKRKPSTVNQNNAPKTDQEKILVELYADLLGYDRNSIGIHDNFFELGGNSLKAAMLSSHISKVFGAEFPLKEIFRNPTVREMATVLMYLEKDKYVDITPVEEREHYPLSSSQRRLFLLHEMDPTSIRYNMTGVLIVEGKIDKDRVQRTLSTLIQRHESLRTSFHLVKGEPVQIIHPQRNWNIDYVDCYQQDIDEFIKNNIRPFDLTEAPLCRVIIGTVSEEKQYVLFDMHHIIADGWSMNKIVEEFSALYSREVLPKLKLQYKDYAAWQQHSINENSFKKQEDFWVQKLSEELPSLELPRKRNSSLDDNTSLSLGSDSVSLVFEQNLFHQIKKLTNNTGTTPYMFLFSIINIAMSKYSGQNNIIIGTPVAARPHADLENVIGMFVNTLAIRSTLKDGWTYEDFLYEVKQNLVQSFEYQYYPFDLLVEKLNIKKEPNRNPLFDVMFMLNESTSDSIKLDDLKVTQYPYQNSTSKFDITITAFLSESELKLRLKYNPHLYSGETMNELIENILFITRQVLEDRRIKLEEIQVQTRLKKLEVPEIEMVEFDF